KTFLFHKSPKNLSPFGLGFFLRVDLLPKLLLKIVITSWLEKI
ncbi:hypothetical protein SMU93_01028, partial [Streptococcus mutans 21]